MENKKYKVNLSYFTYSTLINDIEAFRFLKKDKSTNKNLFINKLIYNYHKIINSKIDDFENSLIELLKDFNNKNKNSLIEEIIRLDNKKDEGEEKKEYELTFISTSKYLSAFIDIEDNYLKYFNFSEYLRKLFNSYALLNQDERERIIFKSEIEMINEAIKENKKIVFKIDTFDNNASSNEINNNNNNKTNLYEVTPFGIYNSKDRQFAYLIYFNGKNFYPLNIYKIKDLRISKNLKDEIEETKLNEINKLLDSSDPQFISSRFINVKIKLNKKGIKNYTRIFINRPKAYKIEDDIYYFYASTNQLFLYFSRFGNSATILNNNELKNRLRDFYYEGYKNIVTNKKKE